MNFYKNCPFITKVPDFDQVEHTIEEGYVRIKEKIEEIRTLLQTASLEIRNQES